ncbi:MAG: sigma-70 family RNA polymerase sigma factor [Planctomycetota bacterium]
MAKPLDPDESIESLFEHSAWVRRLALRLVADDARADDLAQDAWLAANEAELRDPGAVRAWLRTLVRHLASRGRRSEQRRREREARVARDESLPATADLVERAELQRRLVDAVLGLPEPYRSTVLLRYFHEMSAAEMAKRLGVPAPSVRTRLRRGLQLLRERLNDDDRADSCSWRECIASWWLLGAASGQRVARGAGAGSAVAAAVGGVIVAKKLVVVATVTVLALFIWLAATSSDEPREPAVAARERDDRAFGEAAREHRRDPESTAEAPPRLDDVRYGELLRWSGSVIEATTGEPVEGASIEVYRRSGLGSEQPLGRATSGADGRFALGLGREIDEASVFITATKSGFVPWAQYSLNTGRADLLCELTAGVIVRGIVVDAAGRPVESGRVVPATNLQAVGLREDGGIQYRLPSRLIPNEAVQIAAGGRFEVALVGSPVAFQAVVPGHPAAQSDVLPLEEAARELVRIVVPDGSAVVGFVTGPDGTPIPGVKGRVFESSVGLIAGAPLHEATSDDTGRIAFEHVRAVRQLVLSHPEYIELSQERFRTHAGAEPFNASLQPGRWVTARLIDEQRRPVSCELVEIIAGTFQSYCRTSAAGLLRTPAFPLDAPFATLRARGFDEQSVSCASDMREVAVGDLVFKRARTLTVHVMDLTGAGIPCATVEVRGPAKPGPEAWHYSNLFARISTDQSGRAVVSQPSESTAFVQARAHGMSPSVSLWDSSSSDSRIELVLRPEACVVGRVIDRDGRPQVGVRLRIELEGGPRDPFCVFTPFDVSAHTDREGRFRVGGLHLGLRGTLRGYQPNSLPWAQSLAPFVEGERRDLGDILLDPGRFVSGDVRDETDTPVAGCVVHAAVASRSWPSSPDALEPAAFTLTDRLGRFEMRGLPASEVSLQFDASGFTDESIVRRIDLATGDERGIVVTLTRGEQEYDGVVRLPDGSPLVGVDVEMSSDTRNAWSRRVTTGPGGAFACASVPRGSMSARVWAAGPRGLPQRFSADSVEQLPRVLTISNAAVELHVTERRGMAIPSIELFATYPGGTSSLNVELHNGVARLERIPEGALELRFRNREFLPVPALQLEARSGQVQSVAIELEAREQIDVRVVDRAGAPVANALVVLRENDFPTHQDGSYPGARTSSCGEACVALPPPENSWLYVEAEGMAPFATTEPMALISDGSIEVELGPGSSLAVRLVDGAREPIDGIDVRLSPIGRDRIALSRLFSLRQSPSEVVSTHWVTHAVRGRISFDHLPAGDYELTFRDPRSTEPPSRCRVAVGEAEAAEVEHVWQLQ